MNIGCRYSHTDGSKNTFIWWYDSECIKIVSAFSTKCPQYHSDRFHSEWLFRNALCDVNYYALLQCTKIRIITHNFCSRAEAHFPSISIMLVAHTLSSYPQLAHKIPTQSSDMLDRMQWYIRICMNLKLHRRGQDKWFCKAYVWVLVRTEIQDPSKL